MRSEKLAQHRSEYFDELLERIRDIRASEKRVYQKIRDIYKLAVDCDPKAEETQLLASAGVRYFAAKASNWSRLGTCSLR